MRKQEGCLAIIEMFLDCIVIYDLMRFCHESLCDVVKAETVTTQNVTGDT